MLRIWLFSQWVTAWEKPALEKAHCSLVSNELECFRGKAYPPFSLEAEQYRKLFSKVFLVLCQKTLPPPTNLAQPLETELWHPTIFTMVGGGGGGGYFQEPRNWKNIVYLLFLAVHSAYNLLVDLYNCEEMVS